MANATDPKQPEVASVNPIVMDVEVKITALVYPEPGGGYSVRVPALPGCSTEGETLDEVRSNVREAAEGWLEVTHQRKWNDHRAMPMES